jgi:hypothetical protein
VSPGAGLDGRGKSGLPRDSIPGPSEYYSKNKEKYRLVRNAFKDLSTRKRGYWFVIDGVGERGCWLRPISQVGDHFQFCFFVFSMIVRYFDFPIVPSNCYSRISLTI